MTKKKKIQAETQLYSQKPSEPKPEPEPREVALCDTYYSTDDSAETLLCTDPDEAIGEALDLVTANTAQWVKEHWLDWDEDPERKAWVEARL